jgi:hypothetical protein
MKAKNEIGAVRGQERLGKMILRKSVKLRCGLN